MAAELKDFRGKITGLAWCWLEAEHRATGNDQSEIVRDILHLWAEQKNNAAIEAQKLLEAVGSRGNRREHQGTAQMTGATQAHIDAAEQCWQAVNAWIKPGDLGGNGCDLNAQRNGMILATNLIRDLIDRMREGMTPWER